MSMGIPGFDPGADAARRAAAEGSRIGQDNARIGREQGEFMAATARARYASGSRGSKWGILVVLVFVAVVGVFGYRLVQSHSNLNTPAGQHSCSQNPGPGCVIP